VQTKYNINSLNWVLGHIAVNRDNVLRALGSETLLSATETARYIRESEPVMIDGEDVISLERLLDILEKGQEKITAGLAELGEDDLTQDIQVGKRKITLGARLYGLYFHDTYHTGQTDLLRQIAGTNDKII
jgi:uncharacterized damage-inducible protein DinB